MARRNANGEGSIYRRKDGRFEAAAYFLTTAGMRKRVRVYGKTREEVHAKLVEAKTKALQGIPQADRLPAIAEYLDRWLETVVKVKRRPKTYSLYELTVRLYLKPGLGRYPLNRLTVAIVQDFLDRKLAEGKSVRRVQVMRTVLSAALTRAMHEELLQRNVARLVELPTWHRQPIHPWSLHEAKQFLTSIQSDPLCPAFLLLLLYGPRRGEVLGLRWNDIDFTVNELRIRQQLQRIDGKLVQTPVKTEAGERDLPLFDLAKVVLIAHRARQNARRLAAGVGWPQPEGAELVFTTATGQPLDPDDFSKTFHRLREAAGLRRVKLHHLRHTAATLLKDLGVPDKDIQVILGHAQISTTQSIYQHADMDSRREALQKVESLYLRTAGPSWPQQRALPSTLPSKSTSHTNSQHFYGGPGGTRTLDILLKSPVWHGKTDSLTEAVEVLKERTKLCLLGRVAVKNSRQVLFGQTPSDLIAIWSFAATWLRRHNNVW
jgi:integrase